MSQASFGTVTYFAGSDIPFAFDSLTGADLTGATLQFVLVNKADATDRITVADGSITRASPTWDVSGLIPSASTLSNGGKTYDGKLWRTDDPSKGPLIVGTLVLVESAQPT